MNLGVIVLCREALLGEEHYGYPSYLYCSSVKLSCQSRLNWVLGAPYGSICEL